MVIELVDQCAERRIVPTYLVHASGSAGTQAGISAMLCALDRPFRCIGIDIDAQPERVAADVQRVGREAAGLLGAASDWSDACVAVVAGLAGHGYDQHD